MASRRCWTWSTDRFALRALCALHMWLYVYMPRTICGVISTFLPYFHDFLSTCLLCLDVYSFTWSFDFLLGREWTRGLNKQGVGKFSEKQINGGWNKQRGGAFCFLLFQWREYINVFQYSNKVAIYGKGKKCWSNVKTNFSDPKIWPGNLKVEMKY